MHPHTNFGIPTSKNIGDMHLTQSEMDGQTDRWMDGWMDGQCDNYMSSKVPLGVEKLN